MRLGDEKPGRGVAAECTAICVHSTYVTVLPIDIATSTSTHFTTGTELTSSRELGCGRGNLTALRPNSPLKARFLGFLSY